MQPTTKGLGTENHVNTVNRHQHTATAMQHSQQSSLRKQPHYHQACQHCQQMSTPINSCQQRLCIATLATYSLPKSLQALKTMSTLSTDINTLQQQCNTVNRVVSENSPTIIKHVNTVNRCQHLSTVVNKGFVQQQQQHAAYHKGSRH